MDVHFNINDVFSKNKVLVVKEMEKSLVDRKKFITESINNIVENNEKAFISPILYDVLISMIYKSTNHTFCDDIDPSNTITFDVDGSKNCVLDFGELIIALKQSYLIIKNTSNNVKIVGVKVCVLNALPISLMVILQ